MPAGAIPVDVAKEPKGCLIAITIELHEHAVAYAARVARERRDTGAIKGRNPACVGQDKASDCGCAWPKASDHLGDLTRKFYQTLDVHNAAGLGRKFVWAGRKSELQRLAVAD